MKFCEFIVSVAGNLGMSLLNWFNSSAHSTGVGDPIVEELQRSLPCVTAFRFTSQSKQQIMEGLAARIQGSQTDGIVFPDGWLRSELESFEFEYSRNGVKYSSASGTHDDGVCALALAVRHIGAGNRNTLEVRIL